MKKNKLGFSLAELLIAIGIISVIAMIGFSISKQGIERAYRHYIYTGYNGISSAIINAETTDSTGSPDINLDKVWYLLNINTTNYPVGIDKQFTAPNGIKFTFIGDKTHLEMVVPTAKTATADNGTQTFCFRYDMDKYLLYPMDSFTANGKTCNSTVKGSPNALQYRKDLLPFYIVKDDMTTIKYTSLQEAVCTLYGNTFSDTSYGCTGSPDTGIIKLANPKKVL